jgi:hypothetical protein
MNGSGGTVLTPYAFFTRPYFGMASATQETYSPWTDYIRHPFITAANVSTYIKNAAIDTLRVAGGTVTSMNYNDSALAISDTLSTGYGQDLSTSVEMPSEDSTGCVVTVTAAFGVTAVNNQLVFMRILRNGVGIHEIYYNVPPDQNYVIPLSFHDDTPGSNPTYTVQFKAGNNNAVNLFYRTIIAIGGKR